MKKINYHISLISTICSLLLILMWTYAALSKLFIYETFRFDLLGHELIKNYAPVVAWLVPSVELLIAALLLSTRFQRTGFYSSLGMLAIFTGYIIYMFNFYPHTPCSCGGVISTLSWKEHIVFNGCFFMVAVIGLLTDRPGTRLSAPV